MSIKDTDRKARANYRQKVERFYFEIYPSENDIKTRLAEIVESGEPKATYIKRLIREDIERNKG